MIDIIGWAGAVSLLLAYRLVTIGRVRGNGAIYLLLNMFGAVGLGLSTVAAHAWPSAVNNGVWLLLGLVPLARALGLDIGASAGHWPGRVPATGQPCRIGAVVVPRARPGRSALWRQRASSQWANAGMLVDAVTGVRDERQPAQGGDAARSRVDPIQRAAGLHRPPQRCAETAMQEVTKRAT